MKLSDGCDYPTALCPWACGTRVVALEREGEAMVGGSLTKIDSRVGSEGGVGAMGSKTRREMS